MAKPLSLGIKCFVINFFNFFIKNSRSHQAIKAWNFYMNISKCDSKLCLPALYWLMWIKVVTSQIFLYILFTFVFRVLNFLFLTTSLSTTSLNFFKSTGRVFNLPSSESSTLVFKLFKLVGTLTFRHQRRTAYVFQPHRNFSNFWACSCCLWTLGINSFKFALNFKINGSNWSNCCAVNQYSEGNCVFFKFFGKECSG